MMPGRSVRALAVLLFILTSAQARERTLQEQAKEIHEGSQVLIQLKNGNTVFGRISNVTDTQFGLTPTPSGPPNYFLFQNVSTIRRIRRAPKAVEALAIIPLAAFCGVAWIFNRNACSEL
jgi:hypothetical protein